jgi:membrane associated rhomboid family serine protease
MAQADVMRCYRHPSRETRVSCSECGRPICTDCMVFAPVGIRCPEHAGAKASRPARATATTPRAVRRASHQLGFAPVTKLLIGVNVLVFLVNLAQGASLGQNSGNWFIKGCLFGPAVANGDWWRLITAAFLHGGLLHIAMNMLVLWFIGAPVEEAIGRWRFLVLYFVSGLAGSAGALLFNPTEVTVGASGAIFGIAGAALVFERQGNYVLGGSALSFILINLVLSFAIPNVSIGGHIGGLVGGALCGLVLTRFGRGHAAYSRLGIAGIAGLVAIGVIAVVVSYWKVRGYA